MMSAEFYKLRTQRNPLLYAAVLVVGVLIPSIVLIWYTPTESAVYTDAFRGTFGLLSILIGIEFGGWLLGSEYRHGTVKRMLTSEPRRLRALGSKGIVGAGAMAGVLTVSATLGWAAARLVGSMNDATVPWQGRDLIGDGLTAMVAATVAYGLSAITRSDSFAKVGTIALILVLEPILAVIPNVGKYTIGEALHTVTVSIAGEADLVGTALSPSTAVVTLVLWLTAFLAAGATMFAKRDV